MQVEDNCEGVAAIEEETIDIRRYIGVFVSRWWLIILLPLLGAFLSLLYSRNQEIIYEARATLLVKQSHSGFVQSVNDFTISQQLASTYRRLVITTPFLAQVVEQNSDFPLTTGQLKSMISATTASNPPVVEIKAKDSDPVLAARTADIVAREFIDYVVEQRLAEIARLQSAAAAQGIINVQNLVAAQFTAVDSLAILEPVAVPGSPIFPRTRQNVMLGVFVGLALAAGLAILLEALGDKVRSPDEITRRFGTVALGSVFRWSHHDASEDELVLWKSPTSSYAESFRQIRANVQFAIANQPGNAYLVCSPGPGEGKSTVTCNLAIAFAQLGKRVVIVDGDLRRATVHKRFETIKKEPGLSNYLADMTSDLGSAIHETDILGVSVIPSGPTPPNPAELLGSPKMDELLTQLKEEFDFVVVDSAPILLVADGPMLPSQVDGAIVVVDGAHTRTSSLRATLGSLKNAKVNVLGVIVNKVKRPRFSYGNYSYPYYYSNNGYYGNSDSGGANSNGHKKFYQRPAHWVKAVGWRNHNHKAESSERKHVRS